MGIKSRIVLTVRVFLIAWKESTVSTCGVAMEHTPAHKCILPHRLVHREPHRTGSIAPAKSSFILEEDNELGVGTCE